MIDDPGSISPDDAMKKSSEDLERAKGKAKTLKDLARAMSIHQEENHFGASIRKALGL